MAAMLELLMVVTREENLVVMTVVKMVGMMEWK